MPERAVSPATGAVAWVLIDSDSLELHPEAKLFTLFLRGMERSPETMRAYVPRVGLYLNWCEARGVDFRSVTLVDLGRFRQAIEARVVPDGTRLVSAKTVNATLTAVLEFLRFGVGAGFVASEVVDRLIRRKFIRFQPRGFNPGEGGQFLATDSPLFRAKEREVAPSTLTPAETTAILAECNTSRDRFLVVLLAETGVRIGEALGMRREDVHLLPDSQSLGCRVSGSHIHIVPRSDNANGARVKSGRPRTVPVNASLNPVYRDYRVERERLLGADECDFVFVNFRGTEPGSPLTYSNTYQVLRRAARRAGVAGHHPHQHRHSAATAWIRAGVAADVVQALLGHASAISMSVYLHASDEERRAAVERVAAMRGTNPQ